MSKKKHLESGKGKRKQLLKEYKRIRKRFIPPLAQVPNLQEVSYINQLLPEILWLGLINDKVGYSDGIKISCKLAMTAKEIYKSNKFSNFALCTSYIKLSKEEKNEIVDRLKQASDLALLQPCLAPFIILYEGFPLDFLGTESNYDKSELVAQLKRCVKRHFDKYATPAMAIQAEVIYIRGRTGGLYLPQEMEAPDLNAIISSPESEKASRASAFVRTSVLQEIMLSEEPYNDTWARSFWNQGMKVDACELKDNTNE